MSDDFARALQIVLRLEGDGRVSRDPHLTRWGISQHSYPSLDIEHLTADDASAIYWRDYWLPCACDRMSWPVNLYLFDGAVNQGAGAAIRALQLAAKVEPDGIIGPVTLAAVRSHGPEFGARLLAERAMRYIALEVDHLDAFDRYIRGWLKRLFLVAQAT